MRAVLEWAVAMELRTDNPCDRLGRVLGSQNDVVQHMRAVPHREVASAIETVRAADAPPVLKLALRVPGSDGGAVERGARGRVGGDRSERGCVGGSRHTYEGQARTSGPAMRPRHRHPQRGPDVRRRQSDCLHRRLRAADHRKASASIARKARDHGRTARFPIVLPGLGGRGRLIIPARSSRRHSRMWSATRSKQLIGARTYSSAGVGSWTIG